ncbi:MAG: hypothetical protein QNK37_07570 [Acidobacteriota bacterium]|nr:hypothetical protein [Acidobacteriota bacterium]
MITYQEPGCFPAEETAFPGPYKSSRDLPLGDWNACVNGRIFTLRISAVNGSKVTASFTGAQIVNALYDRNTGLLTFTRVTSIKQDYRGFLMYFDDADPFWRMAGEFGEVSAGPQAGWYATLPRKTH